MLCELRVENLLLIERTKLVFASGLNVLTGETGAGKTVLAHALDLLMGGRSRSGIVRPGAQEAYVEGMFSVPEGIRGKLAEQLPENVRGNEEPQELTLARRVHTDGRTRAYVNGRTVAVGDLRELGGRLIAFYGQHEHRKLVLAGAQLQMLDEVCPASHAKRLEACGVSYREIRAHEAELERLAELAAARERDLGHLEHDLAEIEAVAPEEQEYQGMLLRRERLRSLEALQAAAAGAFGALRPESSEQEGAAHLLATAGAKLEAVSGIDPNLDTYGARCAALAIEAQDIAGSLQAYCEEADQEDETLEHLEGRLAALERLMRKHGGSIHAIQAYAEQAGARREELLSAGIAQEHIAMALASEQAKLEDHVLALRANRTKAAKRLASAVRGQFGALAMSDATFEIALKATEPKANGADTVEFTIAPNPGVDPAPLREIASGGELSRVMLALTSASHEGASAKGGSKATLVFDEIDAGIGGHTARAVGERLQSLASERQVLCITHLPQIASLAGRHFSIAKDTSTDPTVATVSQLRESEVVAELVRMLGAEDQDSAARQHAEDLRRAA